MTSRTRTRGVAVLLAGLLALTACSSNESELSPAERLKAAKTNLDETSGVHITLATDKLPPTVDGLLRAEGTATHDPAFKGAIVVNGLGATVNADVVSVNGTVYAKLPFTTQFVQVDPSDYGAPDPADLMDTRQGLSSLLTAAEDVTQGKQRRDGKVVLDTYAATVPGKAVAAVIPSASASATFDATFTVDGQDRLGEAVLTGPFYPKAGDVTYTVSFDDYGATPTITAP